MPAPIYVRIKGATGKDQGPATGQKEKPMLTGKCWPVDPTGHAVARRMGRPIVAGTMGRMRSHSASARRFYRRQRLW